MNNEPCGKNAKGGVSLWDVTDPLKPKKLSEHFGDRSPGEADAHEIHSAFAWDAGDNAYVVLTDNVEVPDVDMDVTNPRRPRLIVELDLNDFDVDQPELGLTDSFLHDMVVKQIDGRRIMLLPYWDGGWVLLDVTDPANPEFIRDSDYPAVDPELLESFGTALTPRGQRPPARVHDRQPVHHRNGRRLRSIPDGRVRDHGPVRGRLPVDDRCRWAGSGDPSGPDAQRAGRLRRIRVPGLRTHAQPGGHPWVPRHARARRRDHPGF